MRTHYETLGISRASTPAQVKSAYRQLVLKHHPDKSNSAESKAIFLAAQEAYAILSDPMKRRSYDATLDLLTPPAPKPRPQPRPEPQPGPPRVKVQAKPEPPKPTIPQKLGRLQSLFAQGRLADVESLAQEILAESPREAIPYAIMGDVARGRGDFNEAARLYAYAAQFAPANPDYQRRYEELLNRSRIEVRKDVARLEAGAPKAAPAILGAGLVFAACSYVVFSSETPVFGGIRPLSTWTLGLVAMLFIGGVVMGASMALGGVLDRFQATILASGGKTGPQLAIAIVAALAFWLACLLYVALGIRQRAFNLTTTRLFAAVGACVVAFALAAGLSRHVSGWETLAWGGNVIAVGSMCGWMVSDAFRTD